MNPHHDKDIMSLAMFPLPTLARLVMHVWIVGYHGALKEYMFAGP